MGATLPLTVLLPPTPRARSPAPDHAPHHCPEAREPAPPPRRAPPPAGSRRAKVRRAGCSRQVNRRRPRRRRSRNRFGSSTAASPARPTPSQWPSSASNSTAAGSPCSANAVIAEPSSCSNHPRRRPRKAPRPRANSARRRSPARPQQRPSARVLLPAAVLATSRRPRPSGTTGRWPNSRGHPETRPRTQLPVQHHPAADPGPDGHAHHVAVPQRPAPNRASAQAAAFASFSTTTERIQSRGQTWRRGVRPARAGSARTARWTGRDPRTRRHPPRPGPPAASGPRSPTVPAIASNNASRSCGESRRTRCSTRPSPFTRPAAILVPAPRRCPPRGPRHPYPAAT